MPCQPDTIEIVARAETIVRLIDEVSDRLYAIRTAADDLITLKEAEAAVRDDQ